MIGLRGIPATHGGVERAVEQLSVQLTERGNAVTVYGRTAYVDERLPTYRGIDLRYLPQINTKHLEAASHTIVALAAALRSRDFDVLHIHASGPAMFSMLPRLAGMPTVVTVHAEDWRREKWGPVAQRALRVGLRIAATVPDRTIVVSRELQKHLEAQYGAAPVHIPNGIDPSEFEDAVPVDGFEPGGFLLFIGRLVPEKGVHTLLRAFARTDVDRRLVIAGGGTHSSAYVSELEALAAADPRVTMLGPVYGAQKAWLLRNAQALVQPSTLEGMPIVLLEAAACGLPCLVSDIPEHMEVVRSDGTALAMSFAVGDEGELKRALERTVAGDADGHGPALRDHVLERYRWSEIAERTEAVYREAIRARSNGR